MWNTFSVKCWKDCLYCRQTHHSTHFFYQILLDAYIEPLVWDSYEEAHFVDIYDSSIEDFLTKLL